MDQDFNTSDALGALFTMVTRVNAALDGCSEVSAADRDTVVEALESMDRVLGLLEVARAARSVDEDVVDWVEERIQARQRARAEGDFEAADSIRDELTEKGIVLEDGPEGTRWKVVS